MSFRRFLIILGGLLIAALPASRALAQGTISAPAVEFSMGVGYANLSLGSNSALDSADALRFEPAISMSPFARLPQLRIGAAAGVSMVLDNSGSALIINNGGLIFFSNADIPFWTLEPELRISWRQTFGNGQQLFIEPGLAGGVAFGWVDLHTTDQNHSYSSSDRTAYGRVYLRGGVQVPGGVVGLEGSWLAGGRMDFGGDAVGDLREYYIGIYGAFRF
ncbi:MAG TPA: hypothetical protein VH370_14780 [Humisphaera sp.]|jgi:hypothetical protein|nr:hypothetical protein [Humisphaera sp.]